MGCTTHPTNHLILYRDQNSRLIFFFLDRNDPLVTSLLAEISKANISFFGGGGGGRIIPR